MFKNSIPVFLKIQYRVYFKNDALKIPANCFVIWRYTSMVKMSQSLEIW